MADFPVPDFSFDDGPDDPCPVICSPPRSMLHSLTEDEARDLAMRSGLMISSRQPLRCTSNSSVYEAKSLSDGRFWAVKIASNRHSLHEEYNKRLSLPDSAYLVKTFHLHEISKKGVLVMELCPFGDLGPLELSEEDIWHLISCVGQALVAIHGARLMHLDVSPGNILRDESNFKLADFGTVTKVGEFREGCEGAGPYVSPEALAFPFGPHEVTGQTDIFSFGVVLLETLTRQLAPRGGSDGYSKLRRGEIRLPFHPYRCCCSRDLLDLINSMIDPHPANRPTSARLVELAALQI
jgi:membrane-associated tyrosine/threonine-specific cdc2-inhibitory kinase